MPDPRPGEVPAAAAAPLPALPEIVEPQFQQALVPEMETSGKCPQDSTPVRSPRLYPPLLVSTDGKGEENTGIRGCAPPRNRGKEPHYRCPSEATTASSSGHMGHYHQPPVAQPFSSTDILNWQRHAPLYSGEPQAMIRLMETTFRAHCSTWDDIIQLLVSLFLLRKDTSS